MKQIILLVVAMVLVMSLPVLLLGSHQPEARAQDDSTPMPGSVQEDEVEVFKYDDPARVENGEADWALNETQFVNNYPDGFIFLGNASSSGGDLVSVSILYSHTPIWEEDVRIRGDVDPDTGEMRVEVSGRDADGIPPWLPVNYRWRISDASGTVYFSEWIIGEEYSDNARNWTRFENEDAIVFIQEGLPDDIAERSLEALADTHDEYIAAFGKTLSFAPRVILFNDRAAFEEWRAFQVSSGGTYVVGQASPQWGAIVQFLTDDDPLSLANTVVHEVAHLYQYDSFEFRAPGWFIEGNATFFEFRQDYDYLGRVQGYAITNQLPRLFLDGGPAPASTGPDDFGRWGYDVGYTFVLYFIETYGFEAHRALVKMMGAPENMPGYEVEENFIAALETITGMDIERLEDEWRRWLGATQPAPTLIPSPTAAMRFPATPTPFGQ